MPKTFFKLQDKDSLYTVEEVNELLQKVRADTVRYVTNLMFKFTEISMVDKESSRFIDGYQDNPTRNQES